ncbi:alanine racemase, partial [Bacteriovoracaceae bacterium]|nr:alanine racemase [Bacteriovoracaceae bacterium]
VPLVLKFDTGMNRLGIKCNDVTKVIEMLRGCGRNSIDHLMTHFACSYYRSKENDRTSKQYNEFKIIKEKFISSQISVKNTSVSNSGAIEQGIGLEESHIRPGLMLYGPQSTMSKERLWHSLNISSLESAYIKKSYVKKGTPIGYGATPVHCAGTLLVLPIGYGDGFLNFYSGAAVNYKHFTGRVVGRVNMDLTFVLFEDVAIEEFSELDLINFWDHDPKKIENLSMQLKTIPYQLFCGISSRIPRIYL